MRVLSLITVLLGAASATPSPLLARAVDEGFTIANAGGTEDVVIGKENMLNGTYHSDETATISEADFGVAAAKLPFNLVNNFGGGAVKAYIAGLDGNGKVVFVKSDGSLLYPSSRGSAVPVEINNNDIAINLPGRGQTFKISLPIPIHSGRVYFAAGQLKFFMVKIPGGDGLVQPSVANLKDPSVETNWGFVEFTYTKEGAIYANISYVDFVGFILSMSLSAKDGTPKQLTKGLDSNAVTAICNGLSAQSKKDGRNWKAMCIANKSGAPIRVLSPQNYNVVKPSDFKNYWQGYVDKVWSKYSSSPLVIDTQMSAKKVNCRVKGAQMSCDGDNKPYNKPTAGDIWGCDSGTFGKTGGENQVHLAVIARLCAAFHRSTLLVKDGNVQPKLKASGYYKEEPTNHYSRLVHLHEVDGKGYAFPYDDVNPDGENASGVVSSGRPDTLTVYFGAPPK